MNSKQYNFIAQKDELEKFENYLQSNGYILLSIPAKELPFAVNSKVLQDEEDYWPIKYITQEKFFDKVKAKYIEEQKYYTIDVICSPVIELLLPENIDETSIKQLSRVYFVTGYYDSNKKWIEKDSEFINEASKILQWCRKNFKNKY